jgi:hypothetical protein
MNYNILAYMIFLTLMIFTIVYVGKLFYRNGRIFILSLFRNNAVLTDHVNHILLIAYYLFNIGYTFFTLRNWEKIVSVQSLISNISRNMGVLIFILALTHYMNMGMIYYLSKKKSLLINQ